VPFLFPSSFVDGREYVDGGIVCNVPCHLFPADATLTVFVHTTIHDEKPGLLSELLSLYRSSAQLGQMRCAPLYALHSVPCIPTTGGMGAYDFDATDEHIDRLVQQGMLSLYVVRIRTLIIVFLFLFYWGEGV